ncbi:MAG: hypothetical protein JNM31_09745 [Flavobacteriales bacterium]|nr:hypothetical protein [Flavobacteriales bacterium]
MNATRHILVILLAIIAASASSQQFYLLTGMNRSEFLYKDSQGRSLEGMDPQVGMTLASGVRQAFKRHQPTWFFTAGLVYEHYGMRGTSPDAYRHYYEWRTTYLGLNLGVERDLFTLNGRNKGGKGVTFYLGAAVAPEFMIKGSQTVNNEVYDLRGVEQFDAPFLFLRGTAGFNYCVSNRVAVVVNYAFAHGARFPGIAPPDDEQLAIRTHNIGVGILVAFPNCRYCISKLATH